MKKLSLLSLTALTTVMLAGVPGVESQAAVYPYRANTGSGQDCDTNQRTADLLRGRSNRGSQNCSPEQIIGSGNSGGSRNIMGSQHRMGSTGDITVPDLINGGQITIPGGQIVTETLPGAAVIQPSLPDCEINPDLPGNPDQEGKPEIPSLPDKPQNPDQSGKPEKPELPDGGEERPENPDADEFALVVLNLVNEERAKAGVGSLTLDSSAQEAANVRAGEIQSSFSHTRPDGRSFGTALTDAGVRYSASGENIAYGQNSPEEVMKGWMNSPGHKANILNGTFTHIGIGHGETGVGVDYWTQLFFK